MTHFATPEFWSRYDLLPASTKKLADKNYLLLKTNPSHPSLHFKKIGDFYSVRVGIKYRALAIQEGNDCIWFWIGSHADYDKLLSK